MLTPRALRTRLAVLCAVLLVCVGATDDGTPHRRALRSADGASAGAHADVDATGAASQWQLSRVDGHLSFTQHADAEPHANASTAAAALAPQGSGGTLPHCALIMHFHVQRTGGTHVRALMQRAADGGAWEFVPPNAFRAAWPPMRNAVLGGPSASCEAEWARRRVLVEVQATSNYRLFIDEVLSRANELRKRYAACGCTAALSILLREPATQAVSMYRSFALPRRLGSRAAAQAVNKPPLSLPAWLSKNHDPQTRALLGFNVRVAEIGGLPFNNCVPGAQQRALLHLAGFDVVGVTERFEEFLAALAARTGWQETLAGRGSDAVAAARNAQSYEGLNARWRRDQLSAEELAALRNYTACDEAVYAAAVAAAATHASATAAVERPATLPTPKPDAAGDDADDAAKAARRAAALTALREQRALAAADAVTASDGDGLPRCALVVVYHIAKTGGSYVRSLMQASRAAGDWQFEEPTDFRNMTWPFLRDVVLGGNSSAADAVEAAPACAALHARGRLLAEVHANAAFALWVRSVEPVLPALRARYAACGCRFTTAVLLREPLSAAVSAYRYFPLRQYGADAAPPLEEWIRENHDPQTKALLGFNLRPPELPGGRPFSACTPVAEMGALGRLGAFDVVGTTERMGDWLRALTRHSGWAAPAGVAEAALTRNAQSYEGGDARWRADRLSATERAALRRHTDCDAALYAAAEALLDDEA